MVIPALLAPTSGAWSARVLHSRCIGNCVSTRRQVRKAHRRARYSEKAVSPRLAEASGAGTVATVTALTV